MSFLYCAEVGSTSNLVCKTSNFLMIPSTFNNNKKRQISKYRNKEENLVMTCRVYIQIKEQTAASGPNSQPFSPLKQQGHKLP